MVSRGKSKPQSGVLVREQAVRALLRVIDKHQSLDSILEHYLARVQPVDRPLLQTLCYGVMRWYLQLREWLAQFLDRPVDRLKPEIQILILLGIYQLRYTRIPAHAAIHATVECAVSLRVSRARGLINAILREYQRGNEQGLLTDNKTTRYAHPGWMLDIIRADWPDDWRRVLQNNNQQAPMVLRLDMEHTSREEYLELLGSAGVEARGHKYAPAGIVLKKAVAVDELPGFAQGLVSVQDAAAQLAVPLLEATHRHRVLDACAAPGGKTAHILQQARPAELVAMDYSPQRLEKLKVLLERVHRSAEIVVGDAASPEDWWDGKYFDRILLDVPCSASGVIRRHPDIKHIRSLSAVHEIVQRQARILDAVWCLLRRGGRIVYVTCSVFKSENKDQIEKFLQRHGNAILKPIEEAWGRGQPGCQILPGESGMDGFYFAILEKT